MSDKKPRSIPEIQVEYQNLCLKAGQLQYQVAALNKELEIVNDAIRDLNFEAAASKKAEDDAKAASEAKGA